MLAVLQILIIQEHQSNYKPGILVWFTDKRNEREIANEISRCRKNYLFYIVRINNTHYAALTIENDYNNSRHVVKYYDPTGNAIPQGLIDILGSIFANDYDYNQIIVNNEARDKNNMLILGIFISILRYENLTNKKIHNTLIK